MKAFVTGRTGFIGANLVRSLKAVRELGLPKSEIKDAVEWYEQLIINN
ncbi:hypothetical protein PJF56_03950 [Roseofilum sp. BLCC_M91]|uniref:Uncharacterized protein n=1 Tax=Roseofilum halophilum BLCC-M91 TaxID=3022259 RepID=A0ABT7BGV8_9CYAN|nr:hypothetical protein [Roseofilum halophilum]MDJ1178012.1 hypothetical protein [Roseofilum halophilum BLCC-M91]